MSPFIGKAAKKNAHAHMNITPQLKKFALLHLAAGGCWTLSALAALNPVDLRCDFVQNPLGVDSATPRLSWKLAGTGQRQRQTAYEIIVTQGGDKNPLWDSGKLASDDTVQIPYAGARLKTAEQVGWKVRVWDEAGQPSAWSQTANWTMGVLSPADWSGAKWIASADTTLASTRLRHTFTVHPHLRRALINICGLGQYELTLDGQKVGDDFLSPGWSKYDKTCLYDTRDITASLKIGPNAIGILLGNGMYNVITTEGRFTKFKGSFGPQKAIAQIRLEYADGTIETIGTDESWQVAPGPITFSSIYGGEDYDARLAQTGWDTATFKPDAAWQPATITSGPGGELKGLSCAAPPIRRFEIHHPFATRTLTNGDVVFDLGQNTAHLPEIRVTGPAGSHVRLYPTELINDDGSMHQGSMGAGHRGAVWCEFTKGTDGVETWSPRFFYVGCRYVQVHCTPAITNGLLPVVKSLSAAAVNSASDSVGEFACSNDLFNRIRTLVRWAQRANMVSLMTDCPHRERLGWLEEDHLNGPALRYEFDLNRLFTKTLNDIGDSQLTNGLVPTIAPEYTIFRDKGDTTHLRGMFGDSPEWSSTFILVPWQQYEFAGDLDLFRQHYDAMKAYLAYFGTRTQDYLADYGLGDWYDVGPKHPGVSQLTPIALTATAFYYQDIAIMAQVAGLLGKSADAREYSGLAEKIRAAFNAKFYHAEKQSYATGSQCANSIPLVMNLCEPANRAGVLNAIVTDVRAHTNALTAGDVGYRYLLRALADGGRSDVIFDINNQSDKPGYGLQLKLGATSLTEAWDAGRGSSQDHFMLGQIQEWFYHDLAGIRSAGNGFKQISIAPQPVGDVSWTRATYDSVRGKIVSDWKRAGTTFTLKVVIPPNTTATVYVPAAAGAKVQVNHPGASFLRAENGCQVFATGSGTYTFTAR